MPKVEFKFFETVVNNYNGVFEFEPVTKDNFTLTEVTPKKIEQFNTKIKQVRERFLVTPSISGLSIDQPMSWNEIDAKTATIDWSRVNGDDKNHWEIFVQLMKGQDTVGLLETWMVEPSTPKVNVASASTTLIVIPKSSDDIRKSRYDWTQLESEVKLATAKLDSSGISLKLQEHGADLDPIFVFESILDNLKDKRILGYIGGWGFANLEERVVLETSFLGIQALKNKKGFLNKGLIQTISYCVLACAQEVSIVANLNSLIYNPLTESEPRPFVLKTIKGETAEKKEERKELSEKGYGIYKNNFVKFKNHKPKFELIKKEKRDEAKKALLEVCGFKG